MKFALCILAAFVASVCAQYQQQPVAQAPPPAPAPAPAPVPAAPVPPVGPGIPPFGPGIPPMGIGLPPVFPGVFPGLLGMGLGLPFLGLGGLGLGLGGLGLGLGGLGLRGGIFRGIRGKRDVELQELEKVKCILSTKTNLLNCTGPSQKIECQVKPHDLVDSSIKLRLIDLTLAEHKLENKESQVWKIVAHKSFGQYTFVEPSSHETVLYSVYGDEQLDLPGFWVKDPTCFKEVSTLFKEHQNKVKVALKIHV